MQNKQWILILGSQSPRRKELLGYTFLPFRVQSADLAEVSHETRHDAFVMDLASQKAKAVFESQQENSNVIVLGADTIVCFKNQVLGKPKDKDEARRTLLALSGQIHDVYTGVSLWSEGKQKSFFDCTKVEFEILEKDLLELYLDTNESMDKAGAYGIQAWSLGFIKKIEGSYSNVVGLPVNLVLKELMNFVGGEALPNGEWRKLFV